MDDRTHVPERELRDYLRVFLPDGDLEPALDRVALAALDVDAEVRGPLDLFRIAHGQLIEDRRITPAMEAAVLVEESGLSVEDTADVLGLSSAEVEAAVQAAWHDVAGPAPEAEDDGPAAERSVDAAARVADTTRHHDGARAAGAIDAARARQERRAFRSWFPALVLVGLLVTVAALAVPATSSGGRALLARQGIDPRVYIPVVVLLLVGGGALVLSARTPQDDRTPDDVGPETSTNEQPGDAGSPSKNPVPTSDERDTG